MPEMRHRHEHFILLRFTFYLVRKFQLRRITRHYLKEKYTQRVDVGRRRCLNEFDVNLGVCDYRVFIIIALSVINSESLNLYHVLKELWR